jgi:hypothetical protein
MSNLKYNYSYCPGVQGVYEPVLSIQVVNNKDGADSEREGTQDQVERET